MPLPSRITAIAPSDQGSHGAGGAQPVLLWPPLEMNASIATRAMHACGLRAGSRGSGAVTEHVERSVSFVSIIVYMFHSASGGQPPAQQCIQTLSPVAATVDTMLLQRHGHHRDWAASTKSLGQGPRSSQRALALACELLVGSPWQSPEAVRWR
eukprot:15477354-Alexandrium_andersonii.AAC.1